MENNLGQFEILTHLRHLLYTVRRVVYTGTSHVMFPWAVAYCTVCDRKLGRSLGIRLVITTTHLYDWVQRFFMLITSKHDNMLMEHNSTHLLNCSLSSLKHCNLKQPKSG